MPGAAPSTGISSAERDHLSLTTLFWPPMGLAEPCSWLAAVSPPASWRYQLMSSGLITSAMRTSAVTFRDPSLMLPLTPVWEWESMSPGVTCLPVPSM